MPGRDRRRPPWTKAGTTWGTIRPPGLHDRADLSYYGGTAPPRRAVLQATTVTTYDLDGNVTSITDADANKTELFPRLLQSDGEPERHDRGVCRAQTRPREHHYQYDANGNLVEKVDAPGQADGVRLRPVEPPDE